MMVGQRWLTPVVKRLLPSAPAVLCDDVRSQTCGAACRGRLKQTSWDGSVV